MLPAHDAPTELHRPRTTPCTRRGETMFGFFRLTCAAHTRRPGPPMRTSSGRARTGGCEWCVARCDWDRECAASEARRRRCATARRQRTPESRYIGQLQMVQNPVRFVHPFLALRGQFLSTFQLTLRPRSSYIWEFWAPVKPKGPVTWIFDWRPGSAT